jgi:phosphate:Na+ symporter
MWKMLLEVLPSIFGGLALFIFGMNYMGEGLQKTAGEKMRHILKILTQNPLMGIVVGFVVTAVIQSSSATTVMVVGFVSAGLMTLRQSIGVIMGANIGTTITAWLVSIKISDYAFHILAIGFIVFFFAKKPRIKYVGQVFFGFGALFVGLNIMSEAMQPLAGSEGIQNLMANVSDNSFLGVSIGAVVTGIVQSSSAFVAVVQKLAITLTPDGSPLIGLSAAIPLVLGSSIGTTITAILASIGANLNAKRAAFVHFTFNVIGTLLFIFFVPQCVWLIRNIMGAETVAANMDAAIANFHTLYKIVNTAVMLPFIFVLQKISCMVYRGVDDIAETPLSRIDAKIFGTPSIAMDLAVNELKQMSKVVQNMIAKAKESIVKQDETAVEETKRLEDITDMLKREVVDYLTKILSHGLTERQSVRLTGLMHMAHDIERMGDNCKNISDIAENMINSRIKFSESALSEICSAFDDIEDITAKMIKAFDDEDINSARQVLEQEDMFDDLEERLRERHIERLNRGECKPDSAISFIELIHNIERMTDNCKNVAEAVLDDLNHKLFSEKEPKALAVGK